MAAVMALVGQSAAPSEAVDGDPVQFETAQVRLFSGGEFQGGGTLVDRNWVLTSELALDDPGNPTSYSIRFGVVNNNNDQNDQTNLRQVDRIVAPPQGGLRMLHLVDPVPENMVIRTLATRPPERFSPAFAFGWGTQEGDDGAILRMASTVVYDPVAEANAAHRRVEDGDFADHFPAGIQPMVISLNTDHGDIGSGIFTPGGFLAGVDSFASLYQNVNATGNLHGPARLASYELPVWSYRQWILDTINGAGSSGGTSAGPPRRRLHETSPTGTLPMTLPPQANLCSAAMGSCIQADPGWKLGALLGAGNYRGTALARCAPTDTNDCSFNEATYAAGASARMSLGPTSAPNAPGTRRVMAWCTTTTAFPDGTSPTRPVVRVSFTNDDPTDSPVGYGWWDVTPDQLDIGTGQTPLTRSLATC